MLFFNINDCFYLNILILKCYNINKIIRVININQNHNELYCQVCLYIRVGLGDISHVIFIRISLVKPVP